MTTAVPILLAFMAGLAMMGAITAIRHVSSRRRAPVAPHPRAMLRRALSRGEIIVHYQPVFRADGALAGAEALARWQHPGLGLVAPGPLLRDLHDGREIDELTSVVLGDAAATLARLRHTDDVTYLAVNVPAAVLEHEHLPILVESHLRRAGVDGTGLVLELTETSDVKDWVAVRAAIRRLSPLGVRLALDDFGRGYANLPALAASDADLVKLDKSLIDGVLTNGRSREIVESVVQLATALGMEVVAEGIEDPAVLSWLGERSITYFQGHALGCPQPAGELFDHRWRARPLPLHALPQSTDRGSVALPALAAIVLTVAAIAMSGIGAREWTRARSPETRLVAAQDRLERAYLDVVLLATRSATSDIAAGRVGRRETDDVVAIKGLEVIDAIEDVREFDDQSPALDRAAQLAALTHAEIDQGRWAAGASALMTDVLPQVQVYLAERANVPPTTEWVVTTADLLRQRVATLVTIRTALGIGATDPSLVIGLPLPAADDPDPLAEWISRGTAQDSMPTGLAAAFDERLDRLAALWPTLTAPTRPTVESVRLDDVLSDSLALQLALQEQVDTHRLPGWTPRPVGPADPPPWSWLAAGLVAPGLAVVAIAARLATRLRPRS